MRTFELKRICVNGRCKTFGVLVIKSAGGQISPLTRVNPFNRFVRTESKHLVMMTRKTGMRKITFSLLNLDTFNGVSVFFR